MSQGNRKVQYLVTFAVCLASVTTGVTLSWSTPALPKLNDNETNIQITRVFIVSMSSVWLLYLTKFLWGLGIGMVVTVSSIYLAEISDKDIRGSVTVTSRFMFNFGNFLVMAIGPFVTYDILNYLLLALPTIYFIACWFIPETPYQSLKEGKVEEARKSLMMLRKFKDEKELEDELSSMQRDVKKETVRSGSLKELFSGRQYRKAVIVCLGIKMTQMLSGSIAIQTYLGLILKDSKIDMNLATAFIVFGGVRFVSGVTSSLLADRVGRRPLLIVSYIGTGLSLALSGGYFFFVEVIKIDQETIAPYGIIAFAGIILSVILSTIGFNSLIYVIPAEMFPMNVKSVAMTLLNILGGFSNFFILKLYQQMIGLFGLFGMFSIFASVSLAGGIFSYFIVPETKGKSLREIQVLLQGTAYDEAAENLNKYPLVNGVTEKTELKTIEQKEV